MIILRASFLLAAFACNGIIDIFLGLVSPIFVILLTSRQTNFPEGNMSLIVPVLVVIFVGCATFNYLVCEIRIRLFSKEVMQMEQQEDSLKIIDMFHGKVFIYDPVIDKVVFVKRKMEEDYGLLKDDQLRADAIFKIVANFSLNSQKKDQVRLYDNSPSPLLSSRSKLTGELSELQDDCLLSYAAVLEASKNNPAVSLTFKNTESDQVFQQRIEDLKYHGHYTLIVFVQNVTNV